MEYARPGFSGSRKCFASPARGFLLQVRVWWQGRVSFGELQAGCPQVGVMSRSTSNWRMSVAPLAGVVRQGHGSLGGGGFALGLQNTLSCSSQAVEEPIPYPLFSPSSIRGKALASEMLTLVKKGAVELAPLPSPGFYSLLFVVIKASGSWRLVINLSLLNLKVLKTSFKLETLKSVLLSVQQGDLKDTYLQVLVHPDSRKYLRFVAFG